MKSILFEAPVNYASSMIAEGYENFYCKALTSELQLDNSIILPMLDLFNNSALTELTLHESLRLFKSHTSLGFLSTILNHFSGCVRLNVQFSPKGEALGYITQRFLRESFVLEQLDANTYRVIDRKEHSNTLNLANAGALATTLLTGLINSGEGVIEDIQQYCFGTRSNDLVSWKHTRGLKETQGMVHYLLSAYISKAPRILALCEGMLEKQDNLRLLDYGSGIGLIGIAAHESKRFSSVLNVEPYPPFAIVSEVMGRWCGVPRESTSIATQRTFIINKDLGQYDVVTLVGSLLYVERSERIELLRHLWSILRVGGIMIIHENIKNERYKEDFHLMFEAEELDDLLHPFAPIRYFASTYHGELSPSMVGDKTVFRLLKKNDI
jgi:SAM-dependent methyltransferase